MESYRFRDYLYSLAIDNEGLFLAGTGKGLFRVNKNFNSVDTLGFINQQVRDIVVNANNEIFVNVFDSGVYLLHSDSSSWEKISYTGSEIKTLTKDEFDNIYLGTKFEGKIYKLDKATKSFRLFAYSNTSIYVNEILFDNNHRLFAAMLGLYYAPGYVVPVELVLFNYSLNQSDVSLFWETATETNNKGFEVEKFFDNKWGKIGFVEGKGTSSLTTRYSYNDKYINKGKISYRLKQIDYDGSYRYSDILNVDIAQPLEFYLSQNFPNPFNPSTIINYSLPVDTHVKLKVFDILGNEITTLVNEEKPAGNYEVTFSAHGLSSGIYFYKIQAESFSATKKLILLK